MAQLCPRSDVLYNGANVAGRGGWGYYARLSGHFVPGPPVRCAEALALVRQAAAGCCGIAGQRWRAQRARLRDDGAHAVLQRDCNAARARPQPRIGGNARDICSRHLDRVPKMMDNASLGTHLAISGVIDYIWLLSVTRAAQPKQLCFNQLPALPNLTFTLQERWVQGMATVSNG